MFLGLDEKFFGNENKNRIGYCLLLTRIRLAVELDQIDHLYLFTSKLCADQPIIGRIRTV
jgi:hypothetical protein